MTDTMLERATDAINRMLVAHSAAIGRPVVLPVGDSLARAALEAIKIIETPDDHFSDSDWDWNYRIDAILSEGQTNG